MFCLVNNIPSYSFLYGVLFSFPEANIFNKRNYIIVHVYSQASNKETTRSEAIVDVIFQCNPFSLCYRVVLHNLD